MKASMPGGHSLLNYIIKNSYDLPSHEGGGNQLSLLRGFLFLGVETDSQGERLAFGNSLLALICRAFIRNSMFTHGVKCRTSAILWNYAVNRQPLTANRASKEIGSGYRY
jgi:hypothetical protein